jgi:Lrp/AsnC family transcriptional regulator, leucine-responsive regulatory protein
MPTHTTLNDIDKTICNELQKNGRIHFNELAEIVGLSVPAVSERIRKLEERGVITGFYAKLNPHAFDLELCALIFVTVEGSANYKSFLQKCRKHPEVLECHAVTGEASHILKVRVRNPGSLELLLSKIQQWEGVKKTFAIDTQSISPDQHAKPVTKH